jgi:thioredoxin reductase
MEFKGRGVSYCAIRGPILRDKVVAVVGVTRGGCRRPPPHETATKVYAIPGKKGYSENYPELAVPRSNPRSRSSRKVTSLEIIGGEFVMCAS